MENVNSEESLDSTDVSDLILTIVLKITELLKKNIDSLKNLESYIKENKRIV